MDAPLLSLVLPTFNAHPKLVHSLESIRAQGSNEIEIVVQDGASSDGTPEWLASQTDVSWQSERDAGVYDAMNHAIGRSRGAFLMFMGAGDTLRPGVLAAVVPLLRAREASDAPLFLYGDVWWHGLDRRYDGRFTPWKMTQRCICHQAIFYDRRVFERLGGYSLKYPIGADFALNIAVFGDRAIEKRWLDLVVCDYEGGGLSSTVRDEAFLDDLPLLINRHFSPWVRALYRLRRASPRGLKKLGAPVMRALGWVPDKKLLAQMPPDRPAQKSESK